MIVKYGDRERRTKVVTLKAISLSALSLVTLLFLITFISALTIPSNAKFLKWQDSYSGNESVLFKTSLLNKNQICISPKRANLEDISITKEVETGKILVKGEWVSQYENLTTIYKYPTELKLYSGPNRDLLLKSNQVEESKDICFNLNPLESLIYKIGEQSITITGDSGYDSTDTNITQENAYAHINLSEDELLMYLPFDVEDDPNNITYDYSNNGNDATLDNGLIYNETGGAYGGAYEFNGTHSHLETDDFNTVSTGATTVALWFKANDCPTVNHGSNLAVKNLEWGLGVDNCQYEAFTWGGNIDSELTVHTFNTDVWNHVTMVYDQNNDRLAVYENGILIAEDTSYTDDSSDGIYGILMNGDASALDSGNFNGTMDEVMIWNRNLTVDEIGQIYNSTYSRFYPTGEMLFEDLNFGTNDTVYISIPNCQQLNGSQLSFKINDGDFENLNSTCEYDDYSLSGNLTSADLTIRFDSGTYDFFSPLVVGNITLNGYESGEEPPDPPLTPAPFNGTKSCFAYNYLKPVGNCTR